MPLWKECKDSLLKLIFPTVCINCHQPVYTKEAIADDIYQHAMAPFVCETCIIDFQSGHDKKCNRCGEAVSNNSQRQSCKACEKFEKSFNKVRFVGLYQGTYKQLIHLYKFKNKRLLAKPFSDLLEQKLLYCQNDLFPIDIIAPVPLHISRLRERGFNQVLMILWQWRDYLSKIEPKLLIRKQSTQSQTTLTREERLINMRSVFQLNPESSVQGKRILLVDDVYTTGATVHGCAQVLMDGGAACVNVLTLARA
jgi:ComF family protein